MTDMTQNSKKLGRLKKRSEFLHVRGGKYKARGALVIQMRQTCAADSGAMRVGFTATKKIGNAVVRNRAKRRMREIARALLPQLGEKGMDYVFIARDTTASRPYEALLDDGRKALLSLRDKPAQSAKHL